MLPLFHSSQSEGLEPLTRTFAVRTGTLAFLFFLASCIDSTGPAEGRFGRVAIAPRFQGAGAAMVAFDRVRILIERANGLPALDTVVDFPADADSVSLNLTIVVDSTNERFSLSLAMINAAGDTVFRSGPDSILVSPGALVRPPAEPVMRYTGVGSNAASVRITAAPQAMFFGDSATLVAEALDSSGNVISGTPITWFSLDTLRARFPDLAVGRVVAQPQRGPVTLQARLLTPVSSDTVVVIQPRPNAVSVSGGTGQSGTVGDTLAARLTARVTAADGFGVQGIPVVFAVTSGGGSLGADTVMSDSSGRARTAWRLGTASGPQSVTASVAGLGGAAVFNATALAAAAKRLEFTVQPSTVDAGVPMTPAVQVTARDSFGNVATGFAGTVTLSFVSNPAGASLLGGAAASAAGGVASFAAVRLDRAASGYSLAATGGGLVPDTSAAFDVRPAGPSQLAWQIQPPATAVAGQALAPAPRVAFLDSLGNVVTTATDTITLDLSSNPDSAHLLGTVKVAADSGRATFTSLALDSTGAAYVLRAAGGGLAVALSDTFAITPAAPYALVFTTQPPAGRTAGVAFPVAVTARDSFGNVATQFAGSVTLALAANPGADSLTGTTAATAAAGVASFSGARLVKAAAGYTLRAAASGLVPDTSSAVTITPTTAATLVFTTQPPAIATAAAPFAVAVTARDTFGNTASGFAGTVSLAFGANPSNATLGGTTSAAAASGVASFAGLTVDSAGTGYTLAATATGVTAGASNAFTVAPAAPARLVITRETAGGVAGAALDTLRAEVRDAYGNLVTASSDSVFASLVANPGSGTLGGTMRVAAVGGVATFAGLTLDKAAAGYTVQLSASGLAPDTSAAFTVAPAAAAVLQFTVEPPSTTQAGAAMSVAVTARDAFGNVATGFADSVTVALLANPTGDTLAGTRTVAAAAGVAAFGSLALHKVGTGYTFLAASGALVTDTSTAVAIAPAAAASLVFSAAPPDTVVANQPFGATVTALDGFGNIATGFGGTVVLTIGANPGAATLSGNVDTAAAAGVAGFAGLTLGHSGTGYTLVAGAVGVAPDTTTPFTVRSAAAARLAFTTGPPALDTAGSPFTVVVTAYDTSNNVANEFDSTVTLALLANPAGDTLQGTVAVAAVNGVATFTTPFLRRAQAGATLLASAPSVASDTSSALAIVAAAALRLDITAQPDTQTAGVPFGLTATARDAFGNVATSFADSVSVALLGNPAGDSILGPTTVAPTGGVATFAGLRLRKAAAPVTLLTAATSVAADTTAGITIVPAPALALAFTTQPPLSQQANTAFTVAVAAHDSLGNLVPSFAGAVAVALRTNPAAGTLSGTLTQTAAGGVAAFTDLAVDNIGSGYTLQAAGGGLDTAISSAFAIAAPAGAVYWINTAGGSWTTGSNWSTGSVPLATDTVYIVQNGSYTVSLAGAVSQAKLVVGGTSGTQTLSVPGGTTLTLPNPGNAIGGNGRLLLAGTRNGIGPLDVAGGMDWAGGTLGDSGTTTIQPGAALTISGAGTHALNRHRLVVGGAATWSGSGSVAMGGVAGDEARLTILSGGPPQPASGAGALSDAGGGAFVLNQGLLTSAGGTLSIALTTTNQGVIDVQSGTLTHSGTGTANLGDTIQLAAGAELVLSAAADTLSPSLRLLGAGLVRITAGTATIAPIAGDSVTIARLVFSGGTISGAGTLAVTDSLDWSGGTMTGGGVTRIGAAAKLYHTGAATRFLGNRTLVNDGLVRYVGSGNLSFQGSTLALVRNTAGGTIEHLAGAGSYAYGSGVARLENAGTLSTQGGTSLAVSVISTGTLAVQGGALTLSGNPSNLDGAVTFGAAGAELVLSGTTDTLFQTLAVSGPGRIRLTAGTMAVAPNGTDTLTLARLTMAGGTLQGAGTLVVTDTLDWSGGTMTGGGVTHIAVGARLLHTGASTRFLGNRTLRNAGTIEHAGTGNLAFSGATLALVDNLAGATIRHDSLAGGYSYSSGVARIDNAGTLTTLSGTTSGVALRSSGTLDVQGGALTLNGSPNRVAGTVNLPAATSVLALAGTLDSVVPGVAVSGGGVVRLTAGTLVHGAVAADTVILPRFAITGGTVQGAGVLAVTDSADWSGGTMNGGGTTLVAGAAHLWQTGASTRFLGARTLENRGTIHVTGTGNLSFSGGTNLVVNDSGALIEHTGPGGYVFSSGTARIANAGTLRTMRPVGSAIALTNTGTIEVQDSTFTLSGSPNMLGGTINLVASGAVLSLGGTADTLYRTTGIAGAGFLRLTSGTLVADTAPADTVRVPRFSQTGGAVGGLAVFLVTDSLEWSGGSHTGAGTSILGDTAVASLTGAANLSFTAARAFINRGHVVLGGTVSLANTSAFTNDSGAVIERVAGGRSVISGNPFTNNGELRLTADTVQLGSAYSGGLSGKITGFGVLNEAGFTPVNLASAIEPGASAGALTFVGAVFRDTAAVTRIELGGADTTLYDRVRVTGNAGLAGRLEVSLINGFTPAPGDSFVIMTYGSRTSWFGTVVLPALGATALKVDTADPGRLVLRLPLGPVAARIIAGDTIGTVAAGSVLPPLTVGIYNDLGDLVTTDSTSSVTVAILPGTGDSTAVLAGTLTRTVSGGVATFDSLSIARAGTGYRLRVTAGALAPDTTAPFAVTPGSLAALAFLNQPVGVTAGDTLAPVQVALVDSLGNIVTARSDTVRAFMVVPNQLILCDGICPPPPADDSVAAINGVATFTHLTRTQARQYYVYAATPGDTFNVSSDTFLVTPAAPTTVVAWSGDYALGSVSDTLVNPLVAMVQDTFGNAVPSVAVAWTALTGGGTLIPLGATSDSTGLAQARWVLGAAVDTQLAQASINGGTATATFHAFAMVAGATRQWLGSVSNDWFDGNNWAGGFVPTDTDAVAILASAPVMPILGYADGTIRSLAMEPGATIQVDTLHTLWIGGSVNASYGSISGLGGVRLWGQSGTVQGRFSNLDIIGKYTASDSVVVTGNLAVYNDTVAGFDLGGHRVTVGGTFRTAGGGTITMASAADTLEVADSATWGGGNTTGKLTAGTLRVGGPFLVNGGPGAFAADSGHVLIVGADAVTRSVVISHASASRLGSVRIAGSGGAVTFDSAALLMGSLTTTGSNSIIATDTLEVRGPLLASSAGNTVTAPLLVIHDTIAASGFSVGRTIFAGTGQPMVALPYDTVQIRGDVVLRQNVTTGLLHVLPDAGAYLHVGGHKLTVNGVLAVGDSFPSAMQGGRLAMGSPADTVVVMGDAYFGGYQSDSLLAGTLELHGNFTQLTNGFSGSFQAAAGHTTIFAGTAAQFVSFAAPGLNAWFGNVVVANTSSSNSVRLWGPQARIAGNLQVLAGAGLVQASGSASLSVDSNVTSAGKLSLYGFDVAGNVTADTLGAYNFTVGGVLSANPAAYSVANYTTFTGPGVVPDLPYANLAIDGTRSLDSSITVNGAFNVNAGGNLVTAAADTVFVNSGVAADGAGVTGGGWVQMNGFGNYVSGMVPNLRVRYRALVGGGTDTLIVAGVLLADSSFVLDSTNGRTVVRVAGDATIGDSLFIAEAADTLEVNGRTLVGAGSGAHLRDGALLARGTLEFTCCTAIDPTGNFTVILGGTGADSLVAVEGNLRHLVIAEKRTVPFYTWFQLSGDLTVRDDATADMGALNLSVGGSVVVRDSGLVRLTDPIGGLTIRGDAQFAGRGTAGSLTAGTLRIAGSFTQAGAATSFTADTALTTIFSDTAGWRSIQFSAPDRSSNGSHFGHLVLENDSLQLLSDVPVLGRLVATSVAAPITRTLRGPWTVFAGGLQASYLVFDSVRLDVVDEAGVLSFDNSTFQNQDSTKNHFTLTSGTALTYLFNGLSFTTPLQSGVGHYLRLVNTAALAFYVQMASPTPGNIVGGEVEAIGAPPPVVTWPWP